MNRSIGLVVIATSLGSTGCYHSMQADFVAERTYRPRQSRVATSESGDARSKLRTVKRVAFQLPDECRLAVDGDDVSRTKLLELRCSGLAGELEAQALRAGYTVVSWREIRAASDPLAVADAAGADLLVRVSENATSVTPARILEPTGTTLMAGQAEPLGPERPLPRPAGGTARRCDARFGALVEGPVPAVRLQFDAIVTGEGRTVFRLDRVVAEPERASGFWVGQHAEPTKPRRHKLDVAIGTVFGVGLSMIAIFVVNKFSSEPIDADLRPLLYAGGGIALGSVVANQVLPRYLDTWDNPDDVACGSGAARWANEGAWPRDDEISRSVAAEVIGRLVGRAPGGKR